VRGIIEGFYGPPWSHAARLDVIETLGAHGMNAYVYAPKDDEKHRARWRDPYDSAELDAFRELGARCRTSDMRFGFAISPGLDIAYVDGADREALLGKLTPLVAEGVDWIVLALDDLATRPGLASEQAQLATWLYEQLAMLGTARLSLVPTEYVGTRPSPYLADLARGLPTDVDLMWTGPTVCSPVITADDARAWRDAVGGRPLILWDNYPVNDAVMERELHLGPYLGRDPALAETLDGVLCNPMVQARASLVPLLTAAEFLTAPGSYDSGAAWARAIAEVGGGRADALRALARACADGPLMAAADLPAQTLVTTLDDELEGPGWIPALVALRDEIAALRAAAEAWRDDPDDVLGTELAPWLAQAGREGNTATAALRLLQHVRPVATFDADGAGRAAAPDAELALMHSFALLFAWIAAREAPAPIVLGPRFALHPAVIQLPDGRPALDVGLAVREDASVVDRLCRIALDHYERWVATAAAGGLRVMVDGQDVRVDADGGFVAPPGAVVLVRSGPLATRVAAHTPLPFPDPRLR
jgi:hyaluronoglucosaminidase